MLSLDTSRRAFACSLALLLAVGFAVGCGPGIAFEELGKLDGEIVGGTVETGSPAVVALVGGGGLCSGTLIGALTVLTARHCAPIGSGVVQFGTQVAAPSQSVRIAQWVRHPSRDLALVKLAQRVTSVAPIGLMADDFAPSDIGRNIRHVGFGVTSGKASDSGTKRTVTTPLRQITETQIESGASGQQTCNGDSGGPGLMVRAGSAAERLVGVISNGDVACRRRGYDARVDIDRGWILSTMGQWDTTDALGGAAPPTTDKTAPKVEVVSPADGETLPGSTTLSIVASASDDQALARVELYWAFSSLSMPCDNTSTSGVSCTRSGTRYEWRFRVGTGSRTYAVTATDAAGNQTMTPTRTLQLE